MTTAPARRRRRAGFTLIEVLLVLVILVILASLAMTAYGPIQRNANLKAAKVQLQAIDTAARAYYTDMNAYPPNLEALRSAPAEAGQSKWGGPYFEKAIPLDPWGREYNYRVPGEHNTQSFDISSAGPPDAPQEIGNW